MALIANALWRVGTAYAAFYRFKDSVTEAASQDERTDDELRQQIVELASTYDLPLRADDVTVDPRGAPHRDRRIVHAARWPCSRAIEYPWPFNVDVDAYAIDAADPASAT